MIINPYRFAAAGSTGYLLDDYAGASAAYSLRELTTTSWNAGDWVIEARNTAGSLQSFTSAEVNDGTLVTFANLVNGSATVSKWYDQSGNGNDATQTVTTYQPLIVSGGALITDSGETSMFYNGTSMFMDCNVAHGAASAQSMMVVGNSNNLAVRSPLDARQANDDGLGFLLLGGVNDFMRFHADATDIFTGATSTSTQYLWSGYYGSSTATIFRDGTQTDTSAAPSAMTANTTTYKIGRAGYTASAYWGGRITEVIIYPDDQSANQSGIDGNITTHYGI